jgi:hypothetical protein
MDSLTAFLDVIGSGRDSTAAACGISSLSREAISLGYLEGISPP